MSLSDSIDSRETIFTRIMAGELPHEKIYEDELTFAFLDNSPQAPEHILVIPKKPYRNILEADSELIAALFETVKKVVELKGLPEDGFRLVINTGDNGGQTVFHLHIHILAGRALGWPPG